MVLLAALIRAPLLGPSTLFQDDAWVALVSRADSLSEVLLVGPTAPGFSVLLWGCFSAVGFSSITAQAIPFAAGSLAAGLCYLVGRDRGLHPLAAGLAGVLIAVSPMHISMSGRVKQYSLEAFLGVVLIALAGRVMDRPGSWHRWGALAGLSLLSIVTSSMTAILGAGAFAACILAVLLDRTTNPRPMLVVSASTAVLAGGWYLWYLAPRLTDELRSFWQDRYLSLDGSLAATMDGLWEAFVHTSEWFTALPAPLVAVLLATGAAVLLLREPPLLVLLLGPLLLLTGLAALNLAPLGAGRTDVLLYPGLALTIGASLDPVARSRVRLGTVALVILLTCLLVWPGAGPTGERYRPQEGRPAGVLVGDWPYPHPYPLRDLRPLIEVISQRRQPDDATLLGSQTLWPYALYTPQPVDLARGRSLPGVNVLFEDEPLPLWNPSVELEPALDGVRRTWILIGPLRYGMSSEREAELRRLGFSPTLTRTQENARLQLWTR